MHHHSKQPRTARDLRNGIRKAIPAKIAEQYRSAQWHKAARALLIAQKTDDGTLAAATAMGTWEAQIAAIEADMVEAGQRLPAWIEAQ